MTDTRSLRVISLGAGVQSTTLYVMGCLGTLGPRPEAAVFADTGWEPAAVYRHLAWLEGTFGHVIPIHRVSKGNIRDDALDPTKRFASMPLYVLNERGEEGKVRRQCTKEYKLEPLNAKTRELAGLRPGRRMPKGFAPVQRLIGISVDEAHRMRDSQQEWAVNVYPLVDLGMSRHDCLRWLTNRGYPEPPKSACLGCPFHGDGAWRRVREVPEEWEDVCAFDDAIRQGNTSVHKPALRGLMYLHRSMVPLRTVDLSTPRDRGQLDLFGEECEGMCGL